MNDKVREDVALFRYSLIAPIITKTFTQPTLKAYLEEICARTYDVPYYGSKSYAPKTVKSWLQEYKKHGIEGLFPKRRSDKGSSRVLTHGLQFNPFVKELDVKYGFDSNDTKQVLNRLDYLTKTKGIALITGEHTLGAQSDKIR